MSGVKVNERCLSEFQEFKLRGKCSYIFFRITPDLKEIVPEKSGAPDATYEEIVENLPADECRYVVCHFKYDKGADGSRSKVVFLRWCPGPSTTKMKAASTESFKRTLQGINVDVQGGDKSEVTRDVVFEKCQRFNKN